MTVASCWCCRENRASQTLRIFGSERAICTDCRTEGEQAIELEGRIQELLSCRTWEGLVPKKHRRQLERLQHHRFSSIAKLAEELLLEDDYLREISRAKRLRAAEEKSKLEDRYETWLEARVDRLGAELALRLE